MAGKKNILFCSKCEFVCEYNFSCGGVLANVFICPINLTRCHLLYILETIRSILVGSKRLPSLYSRSDPVDYEDTHTVRMVTLLIHKM